MHKDERKEKLNLKDKYFKWRIRILFVYHCKEKVTSIQQIEQYTFLQRCF